MTRLNWRTSNSQFERSRASPSLSAMATHVGTTDCRVWKYVLRDSWQACSSRECTLMQQAGGVVSSTLARGRLVDIRLPVVGRHKDARCVRGEEADGTLQTVGLGHEPGRPGGGGTGMPRAVSESSEPMSRARWLPARSERRDPAHHRRGPSHRLGVCDIARRSPRDGDGQLFFRARIQMIRRLPGRRSRSSGSTRSPSLWQ